MVGAEGVALSLAKHLTIWQWSIKVQGWDVCPPTLTALNTGQFMTWEEVLENVDDSLWFVAYSCALQRVGEAAHSQQWQWKAWEVGVSSLVRAFWDETGIELAISCTKLCWELPPRDVFRRRERGVISHAITFLDDMAMCIPSLNAWDQFVWPPGVAMPQATTEVEQYGYRRGHAIDLNPIMPVTQLGVTDEEGTYSCAARALVFEGSILVYNPTRDEVEWVPTCSITNDLSWAEERSAVALVNFVPHIPQEVARIARLRAHCLMSWPHDSSSEEEGNGQAEEGEDGQVEGEEVEWEEEDPVDMEEQGEANPEPSSGGVGLEQGETE